METNAQVNTISASVTSVTLIEPRTFRRGAIICNCSTSILYVKFGINASASSLTYKIGANETLELTQPMYTGIVSGAWDSAVGDAHVTELY